MPVLNSNDALYHAFQLLTSTVRDFHSTGRTCLGATLKPQMRRRSFDTFSEQQLGFPNFGDFLRAAQSAGLIQLGYTPGGDLWITLPGVSDPKPPIPLGISTVGATSPWAPAAKPTSPGALGHGGPIRVRPDLWNAFNSFSSTWVYNPITDIAYKNDAMNRVDESGQVLLPIPSGKERVIEWMRSFANMQDETTKTRLLNSLSGDAATYHFKTNVAAGVTLRRAWHRFHIQQVVAAIEAWATSNNVHPKAVTSPYVRTQSANWSIQPQELPIPEPAQPALAQVPQVPPSTPTPTTTLTPRLSALVDELIDQLLRLRGSLQFMEPKH